MFIHSLHILRRSAAIIWFNVTEKGKDWHFYTQKNAQVNCKWLHCSGVWKVLRENERIEK